MKTNHAANWVVTIRALAVFMAVVMIVGVEIKTVQRLQRQYAGLSVYQPSSQQFSGGDAEIFGLSGTGR